MQSRLWRTSYANGRSAIRERTVVKLTRITVTTQDAGEIRVRDNGSGIPKDIQDKLLQPFFTTRPGGPGTGHDLSITYDIVTKAQDGTITVASEVDAFTELVVTPPRQTFVDEGDAT